MTFPSELRGFKQEHFNYWYSLKSFYLAKIANAFTQVMELRHFIGLNNVIIQVFISTLIWTLPVYIMTSQPREISRFFKMSISFILPRYY